MNVRLQSALVSLDGLAIGDAFGEMLSSATHRAAERVARNDLPNVTWTHTDDTEMALAVVETLVAHGQIDQDALARRFAERYQIDPLRGYGKMSRLTLDAILNGDDWRTASRAAFSGSGSMGNGSAMRVAPLGAFFANDFSTVAREAAASAEVTHSHPEGIAGAIAVAIAAASVLRHRGLSVEQARAAVFSDVLEWTPAGKTHNGIQRAMQLPSLTDSKTAVRQLGNGFQVTCPDTVPFALWSALRHLDDYKQALTTTVSADGDCDTNCAIVGGIVALYSDPPTIPESWLARKETWIVKGL